jgi:O-methyltransferase
MGVRTLFLDEPLYEYMLSVSLREPEALRELREASTQREQAHRQISPEQAQFMTLVAQLVGARNVIELGTFRGYSALALALSVPPDGRVITCDVNADWAEFAQRFWERAGVASRIDFRLGPAMETLDELLEEGHDTFDLAFLDADKRNHAAYYERLLSLVRPGGVLLFDNVFWDGYVVDARQRDADTLAVRALNESLVADPRIHISTIPIGDGLTVARKL